MILVFTCLTELGMWCVECIFQYNFVCVIIYFLKNIMKIFGTFTDLSIYYIEYKNG